MSTMMQELTSHHLWAGILRITKSQLQTYVMCPAKYRFQYVVGAQPEFTPVPMVFGKAMHEVTGSFYRHIMVGNPKPDLEWLLTDWKMVWSTERGDPTIRWDEKHTAESVAAQGAGMLKAFHETANPRHIDAVEYPFLVDIIDPDTGQPLDVRLVGNIDLVESDDEGTPIVVELKTASARMPDSKAEDLLDGIVYAYALDQLGYRTTDTETLVRIDVLVKTKTPAFQQLYVNKEAGDYRALARWMKMILAAIEAGVFFPVKSWACKSCQFRTRCNAEMAS